MKAFRVALFSLVACLSAHQAGASASSGTVSHIHVMSNGIVIFTMSTSRTGVPTCAAAIPTQFAFDAKTPTGQARLSVLMTAYAANKTIAVYGTDACGDWADRESVDWFHTSP